MSNLEKYLKYIPTEELARFIESSDSVLDSLSILPLDDIDYDVYRHLSEVILIIYKHYCQREDIRILDFRK